MCRTMLKIENLSVEFQDKKVLKGINAEIYEGDLVYVLGANGSGKTTLLNAVAGRYKNISGKTETGGSRVYHRQFPALFSNMTVRENLQSFSVIMNLEYSDTSLNKWMRKFGIFECSGKEIEKISGGQRQRLALILTLMKDRDIYLFDEADSAMDPQGRSIFFDQIRELKKKAKTIVWISHHVKESVEVSERCFLLKDGIMKEFRKESIKLEYYSYTEEAFVECVHSLNVD